jgi:hypothetical protein
MATKQFGCCRSDTGLSGEKEHPTDPPIPDMI